MRNGEPMLIFMDVYRFFFIIVYRGFRYKINIITTIPEILVGIVNETFNAEHLL